MPVMLHAKEARDAVILLTLTPAQGAGRRGIHIAAPVAETNEYRRAHTGHGDIRHRHVLEYAAVHDSSAMPEVAGRPLL